jgi:hypothetical protein
MDCGVYGAEGKMLHLLEISAARSRLWFERAFDLGGRLLGMSR